LIPSTLRPTSQAAPPDSADLSTVTLPLHDGNFSTVDLVDQDYDIDAIDDDDPVFPTTTRFSTIAYTDASFAVGARKDSYKGM
jgi:hypothetical protein